MVTQQVETTSEVAPEPTPESAAVRAGDQPVGSSRDAVASGERRRTIAVWLAALVAFGLFVAIGRVSRKAGVAAGELPIRRAWSALADNLPIIGSASLTDALFVAAIALFLATTGVGLWLALTINDAPDDVPTASPDEA